MMKSFMVGSQTYIEDGEVFCRPTEVRYTVEDEAVCDFEATAVSQPWCPPREVGAVDFNAKALKDCSLGSVVLGL